MKSFITIVTSIVCSYVAVIAAPEGQTDQNLQPLDVSNLPAPVNIAPSDSSAVSAPSGAPPSIDTSDSEASESGVKTVDTGTE